MKILFDLHASVLTGNLVINHYCDILPIVIAQAIVLILTRITVPTSVYLNSEVESRLTITIQLTIYKKMNSFAGISYFESPEFYDTFQLVNLGAHYGPA